MEFQTIINDATGFALKAGYTTLIAGTGESLRTDFPIDTTEIKILVYDGSNCSQWDGTTWTEAVPDPTGVDQSTSCGSGKSADGTKWLLKVDNSGAVTAVQE